MRIELEKTIGNNGIFDPLYTDFHFKSYTDYPKFYEHLLNYNGIPKLDTFLIVNYFYDNLRFYYNLHNNGFINDSSFIEEVKNHKIDTIEYSHVEIKDGLTAFVGLQNEILIVILDENRNMDFSDDNLLKFDVNRTNISHLDTSESFPKLNYTYGYYENGILSQYDRKVSIYSSPTHPYTNFFNDSLNKKLHIMGSLKDYWVGSFHIDGEQFSILCQGFRKENMQILIKPKNHKFSKSDYSNNKNFEYRIKDTMFFNNKLFIVENLDLNNLTLILKRIFTKDIYNGFRIGETIEDLKLEDLNGKSFKVSDVKAKYTIFDFWGTWCNPCRKTTPLLKEIFDNNSKIVNIVSVAYDNNTKEVEEYVTSNNLNWTHAYIKRKLDASLLHKLRVEIFPTFILMDENFKILFRGNGAETLMEINEFLNKMSIE